MAYKKNTDVRSLTLTALMTALLCIAGPASIPIVPVPISLTNFVLLFSLYVIGTRRTCMALLLYLLSGAVGLPVFSGYQGGLFKLTGATGGYLIGFIFMVLIAGFFIEKSRGNQIISTAGMALGILVDYFFGTAWFINVTHTDIVSALFACVFPFIIGDAIKLVLANALGHRLRERIFAEVSLKDKY